MYNLRITLVNATEGYRYNEFEEIAEVVATVGELYRELQQEYGRCTGVMYREYKNGPDQRVGWVFEKMDKYSDTGKPYKREAWIEVTIPQAPVYPWTKQHPNTQHPNTQHPNTQHPNTKESGS